MRIICLVYYILEDLLNDKSFNIDASFNFPLHIYRCLNKPFHNTC